MTCMMLGPSPGQLDTAGRWSEGVPPSIPVRHLEAQVDGWSVAETKNFRIYHRDWPELAEKTGRVAERARSAALQRWFGEARQEWQPRCAIYVHASGEEYSRACSVPAGVPGYTTVQRDHGRIIATRIDVHLDSENLLRAVVPHEVTHVVLAYGFGERRLPLWAHEALCVLSEPPALMEAHLQNLPRFRQNRDLYHISDLVGLQQYPEPRYLRVYYAQSVSLVDMLVKQHGSRTFMQCLRDSTDDGGFEAALQKHYGWTLTELHRHWRGHAFAEASALHASHTPPPPH